MIDLGYDHQLSFLDWAPDRNLNPQYVHLDDIPKYGALVEHTAKDGTTCESAIYFDTPEIREVFPNSHYWSVQSWEPLTISPSLLCLRCGDHGFIRDGKWVPA